MDHRNRCLQLGDRRHDGRGSPVAAHSAQILVHICPVVESSIAPLCARGVDSTCRNQTRILNRPMRFLVTRGTVPSHPIVVDGDFMMVWGIYDRDMGAASIVRRPPGFLLCRLLWLLTVNARHTSESCSMGACLQACPGR